MSYNPISSGEMESSYSHRIWWSDVVVKKRVKKDNMLEKGKLESLKNRSEMVMVHVLDLFSPNAFTLGSFWVGSGLTMVHILALFGPFTFTWGSFLVAILLGFTTSLLGVTLSYHRNLSHRSFTLPKWLEYFFAYCAVLSLQGDPIEWVSVHRYHHQVCESDEDPHTPTKGFWYSHINWLFDTSSNVKGVNNVEDLKNQAFYRFMKKTYIFHSLALGGLLYAIGGFPYFVWGMGVRTTCSYHMTWCVNSAGHTWGTQSYYTGDLSKNNWWAALASFGEGWHNNHHAFAYSARLGLEWWQVDMTWYVIKFLEVVGLATDVKLPTKQHKQRLALKNK